MATERLSSWISSSPACAEGRGKRKHLPQHFAKPRVTRHSLAQVVCCPQRGEGYGWGAGATEENAEPLRFTACNVWCFKNGCRNWT